jgi:hypothetical protein
MGRQEVVPMNVKGTKYECVDLNQRAEDSAGLLRAQEYNFF